jgi:hypothetical protein
MPHPISSITQREEHIRILPLDALPADVPFTEERIAQLAHEAARLRFHFIKIPVRGVMTYISAKFSPAIHTRQCGLGAQRIAPDGVRLPLFNLHPADTEQP